MKTYKKKKELSIYEKVKKWDEERRRLIGRIKYEKLDRMIFEEYSGEKYK